jgi:Concanavalin A-like lectin/glucanases superfamily
MTLRAAVLAVLLLCVPSLGHPAPCSPTNYTGMTNTGPMPGNFCAYAYRPFRTLMPANPAHIDQTNTTILQNEYAPGSFPEDVSRSNMYTLGRKPLNGNEGNSNYAVFKASASDPQITVNCANSNYGCSRDEAQVSSIPALRIPAWVRPTSQWGGGDNNMEIIQPDGKSVGFFGCNPGDRDWQNGDQIGGNVCNGFGAADYADIVTSSGVNPGTVNGGSNFAALPVHYNEVVQGEIKHALLVFSGCFTGAVYPAPFQAYRCDNPPGIPAGAHIWLSLTRAQIDATSTDIIPVHMRPFAYAAHEYGIFTFDTGNGLKWFGQPVLEDALNYLLQAPDGTHSYWEPWFNQHGGGMSGDANLKINGRGSVIDWSGLAGSLYVVDVCYAQGTCSDSIPEVAPTCPPDCPPPTGTAVLSDLANWWRGWPGFAGSDRIFDLVARNYGTLVGMGYATTTGWSPSMRLPGATQLNFDGTNDYVETTQLAGITPSTPFTLCAMLTTIVTGIQTIINTAPEASHYDGIWFDVRSAQLRFAIVEDEGNQRVVRAQAGTELVANRWYHVCATHDGSATVAGMRLWVDGIQIAANIETNIGAITTFTDRPWRLGVDTAVPPVNWFHGSMEEVMVFRRELTALDIRGLANASQQGWRTSLASTLLAPITAGNPGAFFHFFRP